MLEVGKELIKCIRLSCDEGLLALEREAAKGNMDSFLIFTVNTIFACIRKDMDMQDIRKLLNNYSENEQESKKAKMIADVMLAIFKGNSENNLCEMIASHLGREYRGKLVDYMNKTVLSREEILHSYDDKKAEIVLIEELVQYSDENIRLLIRNLDNVILTNALSGASGAVCKKFLSNISDRLLYFIHDDINQCDAKCEDIIKAQTEIIGLAVELNVIIP